MKALIAFALSLTLCALLVGITIRNRADVEKMTMERLIMEKSVKVTEVISKLLYKTEALAALAIQGNKTIDNFDRVAATIIDDPAILNILVAPGGIVSNVYPLKGNERLIGFDFLDPSSAGNKEAIMAKESGNLVFGGPFNLMQGGRALVGRLPVWRGEGGDSKRFWGLVSVTLKYPQALNGASLDSLEQQGFAYEIWRVNPDDGERQVIAKSETDSSPKSRFIERPLTILNAEWFFRISPVLEWYQYPENWMLIGAAFMISIMIALIMQNNHDLKDIKSELEDMVRRDPLTGLLNRSGLFRELEFLIAAQKRFHLFYIDLNYFKQVNDTYGHSVGDYVLTEFSKRVSRRIAPNSLFARISGDEFILVMPGDAAVEQDLDAMWADIAGEFAEALFGGTEGSYLLSFSKGEAIYPDDSTSIDTLITCADGRMYEEKNKKYANEQRRRATDR